MTDLSTRDDADLVILAQAGSAAAFEQIYDRHVGGVGRALASFAGPDRHLLDDLVQEVFLRVVQALPRYSPSRPFTHWLFTIALNVGRNHVRRPARVVPVDPAELAELADLADLAGAHEPDSDPALASALMRRVAELPAPVQEVVSLRVGADLSYREIAAILHIPEPTARRRMHDAVTVLRDHAGTTTDRGRNRHG
ncbi:MAG: sigma-70 family RNA polymerase sigma factor [Candidatus Krumholzibacteriia bacterium]